jgi:hypothetical protein
MPSLLRSVVVVVVVVVVVGDSAMAAVGERDETRRDETRRDETRRDELFRPNLTHLWYGSLSHSAVAAGISPPICASDSSAANCSTGPYLVGVWRTLLEELNFGGRLNFMISPAGDVERILPLTRSYPRCDHPLIDVTFSASLQRCRLVSHSFYPSVDNFLPPPRFDSSNSGLRSQLQSADREVDDSSSDEERNSHGWGAVHHS